MFKTKLATSLVYVSLWLILLSCINNGVVCLDTIEEIEFDHGEVTEVYRSAHYLFEEMNDKTNQNIQGVRGADSRGLQTTAQIADVLLINADTDLPLISLVNGTIIDLTTSPTSNFNILATVTSGTIGSVRFGHNSTTNYKTEGAAPYAFCGNSDTDYYSCSILTLGFHTITVTSYSGARATGTIGSRRQISFRIIRSPPTKAPTGSPLSKAPTKGPTNAPTYSSSPTSPLSKMPTSTKAPTGNPSSKAPTLAPTKFPTKSPTKTPTKTPTKAPTKSPTKAPVAQGRCAIPRFSGGWVSTPPVYPLSVAETQAELIGSDIIISGGFINSFQDVTNVTYARSLDNFLTSTWRRLDDMPGRGTTHAPTVHVGNKMYMCGGYFGPPPGPHVDKCYVFDKTMPSGSQWSSFPTLPLEGTGGGSLIYDKARNMLFYTGGARRYTPGSQDAYDNQDTFKISLDDISTGWLVSTPIPYHGNHQSFVTVNYLGQEERHYVLGGQSEEDEKNGNIAEVYEFHANNETWSRKADMPFPRGHATVSTRAIGTCGFIIAGGSINGGTRLARTNNIHVYHIPTNTWNYIGNMPTSSATPPVFVGPDDYLYHTTSARTVRRKFLF